MILFDTSVWITIFRSRNTPFWRQVMEGARSGQAAVCGPVMVEFLGGFRQAKLREEIARNFRLYPWLKVSRKAYELATSMRSEEPSIAALDAMIAAVAMTHNVPLMTLDKDFQKLTAFGLKLTPVQPK